ncbi:MAG: NrsF family protein, partial [Terriglobia bacterium]
MITTPELIALLAVNARPVRRLRPPLVRTGLWLLLAGGVFVLLALGQGVRQDLVQRAGQPIFMIGIVASLATGILAAVASFLISLPDRSRAWV